MAVRDDAGTTRIEPGSLERAVQELRSTSTTPSADRLGRSEVADAPEVAPARAHAAERRQAGSSREPEIFAALSAGRAPVQIVIELGVTAAEVEAAVVAWTRLMTPWEPPASLVVEHVDALTACVHELHLCVGALEGRLAQLEQHLSNLTTTALHAAVAIDGVAGSRA